MLLYYSLLKIFFINLTKEHHASKLAKTLKLNQKTVSNQLNKLESLNILQSRFEGKNKLFKPVLSEQTKNILFQIEIEKKNQFLKNVDNRVLVSELSKFLDEFLIFGSYARGTQKSTSDIDVLTVSKSNLDKEIEIQELFNKKITVIPLKKSNFKNEPLFLETKNNHIIIKGFEYFLKVFFEEEFELV